MEKIVYDIQGLDCAHCAAKLADYLNKQEGVKTATLNFLAKQLTMVYTDKAYSLEKLNEVALKGSDDPVSIVLHEEKSLKVKIFDKEIITNIVRIVISTILLVVGVFALEPFSNTVLNTFWQGEVDGYWIGMIVMLLTSYLIISYDYLWKFIKSFRHPSKMFNETVLMVVASLGAIAIQQFEEAVLVMILAQVGEIFEHISVNKSKNSIIDTIDTRKKTASKVMGDDIITINAEELEIGDVIVLKTGEIVPCDGKVLSGNGLLDTSSVTGEFKPVELVANEEVLSGTSIVDGTIRLQVEKKFNDSTTSKILEMVMESSEYKSKAETFISKFANWYTPIMFVLALIIGAIVPLIIGGVNGNLGDIEIWNRWIKTGLNFLVISCPCAIVISVPLTYFVGTTLAFKKGIMVKGSNYLDRLNELSVLVTDKTGTVTTGTFSLKEKQINKGFEDVFDEYVCAIESHSNHPIAKAVLHAIGKDFDANSVQNVHELPKYGITGEYKNKKILLGNISLMNKENIVISNPVDEATYLVIDGKCAGYLLLDDTIKENSAKAINFLSKKGIDTLMLTGGDEASASRVANECGIARHYSKLLPQDKINYLKKEIENKKPRSSVAYIGDGINDAPSIIMADVGIAMGGIGADAAVSNADVVLTNDDPIKLIEMFKIAKTTRARAIFNITFALILKLTVMILSLFQLVPIWGAVLCDTGLSLFLVIVSILLIKKKIKVD